MNKKLWLLLVLVSAMSRGQYVDSLWSEMQEKYKQCIAGLEQSGLTVQESDYCHDIWKTTKQEVRSILLGKPDRYFTRHYCIWNTMVRQGMSVVQSYEALYLRDCITDRTKQLLKNFHESDFLGLDRCCKEFDCSSNCLGHLYYAAKVLDTWPDKTIDSITELGSGYGNLASVFKQLIPEATLYLIDLPELLALQYFFLKATLDNTTVILHDRVPENFEKGAIHLIPVFMVPQLTLKTDLFISTFALSESSRHTQQQVINKNFFNAHMCYVSGQLHGWGDNFKFVGHELIIRALQQLYNTARCQPHHVSLHVMPSYEIIAHN